MDGLAAFLAARLDEREAAAKAAAGDGDGIWGIAGNISQRALRDVGTGSGRFDAPSAADALHIITYDPAAVLADITADRALLNLMTEAHAEMDRLLADKHAGDVERAMAIGRARGATVAVKHRAARYASHPDYRAEWAAPQ